HGRNRLADRTHCWEGLMDLGRRARPRPRIDGMALATLLEGHLGSGHGCHCRSVLDDRSADFSRFTPLWDRPS
ncbi:MAG: hypothetical protein VCC04_07325, partial [Myxococcota bacterium]